MTGNELTRKVRRKHKVVVLADTTSERGGERSLTRITCCLTVVPTIIVVMSSGCLSPPSVEVEFLFKRCPSSCLPRKDISTTLSSGMSSMLWCFFFFFFFLDDDDDFLLFFGGGSGARAAAASSSAWSLLANLLFFLFFLLFLFMENDMALAFAEGGGSGRRLVVVVVEMGMGAGMVAALEIFGGCWLLLVLTLRGFSTTLSMEELLP